VHQSALVKAEAQARLLALSKVVLKLCKAVQAVLQSRSAIENQKGAPTCKRVVIMLSNRQVWLKMVRS
jgi:hypothetical protein